MPRSRTIGSLIITILIGFLTFFFAAPKKYVKVRTKLAKTSVDSTIDEKDDLFI